MYSPACGIADEEIDVSHLLATVTSVNSSLDCQEECQGNADCKSWSYTTDLSVQSCDLFRPLLLFHASRDTFDMFPDCLEQDKTIVGNDISSEVCTIGSIIMII